MADIEAQWDEVLVSGQLLYSGTSSSDCWGETDNWYNLDDIPELLKVVRDVMEDLSRLWFWRNTREQHDEMARIQARHAPQCAERFKRSFLKHQLMI